MYILLDSSWPKYSFECTLVLLSGRGLMALTHKCNNSFSMFVLLLQVETWPRSGNFVLCFPFLWQLHRQVRWSFLFILRAIWVDAKYCQPREMSFQIISVAFATLNLIKFTCSNWASLYFHVPRENKQWKELCFRFLTTFILAILCH